MSPADRELVWTKSTHFTMCPSAETKCCAAPQAFLYFLQNNSKEGKPLNLKNLKLLKKINTVPSILRGGCLFAFAE
jgi:hypothetical protein